VCTGGASTPYPQSVGDGGYTCPPGTYCPKGMSHPLGCSPGTYNPSYGMAECFTCPAGSICTGNSTAPAHCPLRFYCVNGSREGTICPNGTYGHITSLATAGQCATCPGKYYCTDGNITGLCSAGYFCRSGQGTATPSVNVTSTNEIDLSWWSSLDGGPCPPGRYCPAGSAEPILCPNGTVRSVIHGAAPSDCESCPAGYWCIAGELIPSLCPKGYYCPYRQDPTACPRGTYKDVLGGEGLSSCSICPPQHYCNVTGISDYTRYPCPTAHYCVNATTDPEPCPEGTYRDIPYAGDMNDCFICPAGHFCPRKTSVYHDCPDGQYCRRGSSNGTLCLERFYCPGNTSVPISCPASYYCGVGAVFPTPCFPGTYCLEESGSPTLCPLGYRYTKEASVTLSVLSSLESACTACPAGTYGSDPNRLNCSVCTAGYVCLGGTTSATPTNSSSEQGYECPEGYYCPAGSSAETPCDAGTYNLGAGGTSLSDCKSCDANTYQYLTGQSSCLACSRSSYSAAGATTCTCTGAYRIFQPSDGWCICIPSYQFVDANFQM
jgi:hypothetical protein